jgi:hypothetical protein
MSNLLGAVDWAVKHCIRLECEYCEVGVPINTPFEGDTNLYHTGMYHKGNFTAEVTLSPCRACKIRRYFGLTTVRVKADGL